MTEKNDNPIDQHKSEQGASNTPIQIPEPSDIEALNTKVVELENSVNQYKDQLLRKAAEFDNYKKRIENDYASVIKFSNEELITKLLPVIDDFERSIRAMRHTKGESTAEPSKSPANDVFARGLELIYNKLVKILEAQGVKHFDVVGTPFNPELHDALLQVPRSDLPPHTVVEEVEKGYRLHDKVVRHARVIVSTEPHTDEQSPTNSAITDDLN